MVVEFEALVERSQGIQRAHVASAVPLTSAELQRLHASSSATPARRSGSTSEVDPRLIGGALVRIGDHVIDRSVATLLQLDRSSSSRRSTSSGSAPITSNDPEPPSMSFRPEEVSAVLAQELERYEAEARDQERRQRCCRWATASRACGASEDADGRGADPLPRRRHGHGASTSKRTTSAWCCSARTRTSRKATASSAPAASPRCRSARR